ncbi:MAG: hypothetical protein OER87_09585 [Gammaproteobacteria bacterium]|nr:hypothetical protein [Gammaproteobacteria bacterium]
MPADLPEKMEQTVILAADAGSYSLPIVNLAVEIAASVNSKLQGMFIEDEDLLMLSGLSCTREITLTTASERHTSVVQMQRMLRSAARQFEQSLQREAQSLKIAWSYEYVRGRMHEVGLKRRLDVSYTILARSGPRRYESRPAQRKHRILLFAGQSTYQSHALSMLLRHYGNAMIEITAVSDQEDDNLDQDLLQQIRHSVGNISLVEKSREQIFEILGQPGSTFDCAILSMREKVDDLQLILKTLQCPIILVA